MQPKIGDTVNLTPVAGWVKAAWPRVRLVGVSRGPALEVAQACPHFDEVWDRGPGPIGRAWLTARLAAFGPDLVVASYAHNATLRAVRAARPGAVVGVANTLDDPRFDACAVYERGTVETPGTLARLFHALGVQADDWRPSLVVAHGPRRLGQVAVNVAASHPAKEWPLDRFSEASRRLAAGGLKVVWLSAPRSGVRPPPGVEAAHRPIMESAALMAESAVLLTNDSGPMHLAAALGTAVVALFGPTRIEHYRPWGESHRLIQGRCPRHCDGVWDSCPGDCMRSIGVEEAVAAVLDALRACTAG
jgi:hypothetical protein